MIRSAAALCLLFVVGCRHEAPVERKPSVSTFKFEPAAGNALIILYRNSAGFMGGGAMVNSTVTVDKKALGDLTQDRYAVIGVGPGEHLVNLMGASGVSNVMVSVAAGQVRFVQVNTYPTLIGTLVEASSGLKDLDNEGEPLSLGFKYSFVAGTTSDPGTTNL